jgi:hypothetical protein
MLGQIDEKQGKAFFLGHYQNSRIQVLMQNATISPHLGKKKRREQGGFRPEGDAMYLFRSFRPAQIQKAQLPLTPLTSKP